MASVGGFSCSAAATPQGAKTTVRSTLKHVSFLIMFFLPENTDTLNSVDYCTRFAALTLLFKTFITAHLFIAGPRVAVSSVEFPKPGAFGYILEGNDELKIIEMKFLLGL